MLNHWLLQNKSIEPIIKISRIEDEVVLIQVIITWKHFRHILQDNKSTKDVLYDEAFNRMQKYNP